MTARVATRARHGARKSADSTVRGGFAESGAERVPGMEACPVVEMDDQDTEFEADLNVPAVSLARTGRRRERPFPAEVRIQTKGVKPLGKGSTVHGYHSHEAVEIPTTLTCNLCPLYHVKRKDKRHALACPEGRKNQICPILTRRQQDWVADLVNEVREKTGCDPSATDRARVEQIVRYRSRLFQIENYLKVAGLIDLREGEVRAVADRLGSVEGGLTRALGELRQSMNDAREGRKGAGPTLGEYLDALARAKEAPLAIEEAPRKGIATDREVGFTTLPTGEEEGSDGNK